MSSITWHSAARSAEHGPPTAPEYLSVARTPEAMQATRGGYGVVPGYWALQGPRPIVSPTPETLAGCDLGATDLRALREWTWFGYLLGPTTHFRAGLRRLPPRARLLEQSGQISLTAGRVRMPPPLDDHTPGYKRAANLDQLLGDSLARRVGDADVVVTLSGGLDSTAIAAHAVDRLGTDRVRAVTFGWRRQFADPEPDVARSTARALGIDWQPIWLDDDTLLGPQQEVSTTEPLLGFVQSDRLLWEEAENCTVLSGLGGDSLFLGPANHYRQRLRRGEWREALGDVARAVLVHRVRPGLGTSALLRRRRPPPLPSGLQTDHGPWYRDELEKRSGRRFEHGADELFGASYGGFFEAVAPRRTGQPDWCFPFFDDELADWARRTPPYPWFVDKGLLRASLRGRIPEAVRLRPKTAQAGASSVTLTDDERARIRDASSLGACGEIVDPVWLRTRADADSLPEHEAAVVRRAVAACELHAATGAP